MIWGNVDPKQYLFTCPLQSCIRIWRAVTVGHYGNPSSRGEKHRLDDDDDRAESWVGVSMMPRINIGCPRWDYTLRLFGGPTSTRLTLNISDTASLIL